MNDLMRRVASLLAGAILAVLGAWGVRGLPPGLEEALTVWLAHTLDFVGWLAGILLDRYLRSRLSGPSGGRVIGPRRNRFATGKRVPGATSWG